MISDDPPDASPARPDAGKAIITRKIFGGADFYILKARGFT